jgi:hypothetical protein
MLVFLQTSSQTLTLYRQPTTGTTSPRRAPQAHEFLEVTKLPYQANSDG